MSDYKICTKCNISKSFDSFYNSKNYKDGKLYHCKECDSKVRNKNSRTKIGLIHKIYNTQKTRTLRKNFEPIKISYEDLQEWLLNSSIFNELFNNWINSNYNSKLIPSCDRIDDYKGYSLDNLQITTWEENNNRYSKDCIIGKNTKMCKAVIKLDSGNNIIEEYFSLADATRKTGNFSSNIIDACKHDKFCGGYKWRYK